MNGKLKVEQTNGIFENGDSSSNDFQINPTVNKNDSDKYYAEVNVNDVVDGKVFANGSTLRSRSDLLAASKGKPKNAEIMEKLSTGEYKEFGANAYQNSSQQQSKEWAVYENGDSADDFKKYYDTNSKGKPKYEEIMKKIPNGKYKEFDVKTYPNGENGTNNTNFSVIYDDPKGIKPTENGSNYQDIYGNGYSPYGTNNQYDSYVKTDDLNNIANGINKKKDEILEAYNSKIKSAFDYTSKFLVVSGLDYNDTIKAYDDLFNSLNNQVTKLVDVLEKDIIPKYSEANQLISSMFNNEFKEQMQQALQIMKQ